MARFEQADAERTSALLSAPGGPPGPMLRTMAAAPAVLRGYLGLNRALKRSHLDRRSANGSRSRSASGSIATTA